MGLSSRDSAKQYFNVKNSRWLHDVKPGQLLEVLGRATLFPQTMWDLSSKESYQHPLPMLKARDVVVVLDVMHDSQDSLDACTFTALVVTPSGIIGCILLFERFFRPVNLD